MRTYVLIAAAGALGVLARFFCAAAVQRAMNSLFPWGTLAVNLIGCLLFGFLSAAIARRGWPAEVRLMLLTGLLGAFTTYSTFQYEIVELLGARKWRWTVGYLAAHLLLGAAAIVAGLAAGAAIPASDAASTR